VDNLQIFSGPKSAKYGYQLNPYNTMIGALYEYHIAVKKNKTPDVRHRAQGMGSYGMEVF